MRQVLIIDDQAPVREAIARLLTDRYEVALREDALEIVQDFEKLEEPVVLLDVWMPLLNGFAAARLLKKRHPEARIVFLSSDPRPQTMERAAALGDGFVVKTHAVDELIPAIQDAIAEERDPRD